jgi:hypothetical protein
MIPATTATRERRSNIWGGEGSALGGVEGVGMGGFDHFCRPVGRISNPFPDIDFEMGLQIPRAGRPAFLGWKIALSEIQRLPDIEAAARRQSAKNAKQKPTNM